jgi:pullulanase/glycogen debranching enzyme
VDRLSAFSNRVQPDPTVSQSVIAEPWDVGRADAQRVGNFPGGRVERQVPRHRRDFSAQRACERRDEFISRLTGSVTSTAPAAARR